MYEFFFNNLQFPVAPENLKLKIANQNETMNLISGQKINIPKIPGLTEIEFSLLLPAVKYPFAVYPDGFQTPDYYLNALEKLKINKQSFRFTVRRRLPGGQYSFDTDMLVLLEEYTIEEDAGNGFDVTVDIRLKQYIKHGTKLVIVTEVSSEAVALATQNQRTAKEPAKTYTVESVDTLWNICRAQLGDGSRYNEIMQLNGIQNPNEIIPGQVIRFE